VEEAMNRRYRVKGISGIETYIELLTTAPGGFEARITSSTEYGVRESCEFISTELLESCVRTGYLSEVSAEDIPAAETSRGAASIAAVLSA
jgi:hypothetical protein